MEMVFQFLCLKILRGHSNSVIPSAALTVKVVDGIPSVQMQLKFSNLTKLHVL